MRAPRFAVAPLLWLALGPAVARAQAPPALPLSLKLGSGPNDRTGESIRALFQQVQAGVNAVSSNVTGLTASVGKPNGLATLDATGLIPVSQIPATVAFPVANPNITGKMSLTGTTGPDDQNLVLLQALSGSSTTAVGINKNLILTLSDSVALPTNNQGLFLNTFTIQQSFGGPTMTGGRQGLFVNSYLVAPTSPANNNRNYVAAAFKMRAQTGDGGTDIGAGARGGPFAFGADVTAAPGATNLAGLTVAELNIAAEAGSSIRDKVLLSLVSFANDSVAGGGRDAMLNFGAQGPSTAGFRDMILFSNLNGGFPFNNATNLMRTEGGTIYNGINLTASTILGSAIVSPGFNVSGKGMLSAGYIYTPADSIQIGAPKTPASSSAPCATGQISWDGNFISICVGANSWKHVALSSF